jgi:fucose 4-O-acetylase-like acetyltransferase
MLGLLTTVVVPYVIFESLYALFRIRVGDERFDDLYADPHWPLWYLAALFFWRLATPLLKRHWAAVPASVALSVVGGAYAGETLDLARVIGLLPFFVLGLHVTSDRLAVLRTRRASVVGAAVLLTVFALAGLVDVLIGTEWLYYRSRYDTLGVSDAAGMVIRLGLLVAGTVAGLAFFAVVPRRGGWYADAGRWTLVVYLFHGFFVKGIGYTGFGDWADAHGALALVLTTLIGIAVALLLSWGPLARRLNLVVDPYGAILRRRSTSLRS